MKKRAALGAIATGLLLATATCASAATPGTSSTTTPLTNALQQAAALPTPHSVAQMQQQAAQIAPAVNAVVSQGDGAVAQLLEEASTVPAVGVAVTAKIPIIATSQSGSGSSLLPNLAFAPNVITCWGNAGSVWQSDIFSLAGVWLGTLQVNSNGWCGNGTNITSNTGSTNYSRTGVGECFANFGTENWAWVSQPTEGEMKVWGQIGFGVGGICDSGHASDAAVIDVWGSGYWHGYNT